MIHTTDDEGATATFPQLILSRETLQSRVDAILVELLHIDTLLDIAESDPQLFVGGYSIPLHSRVRAAVAALDDSIAPAPTTGATRGVAPWNRPGLIVV